MRSSASVRRDLLFTVLNNTGFLLLALMCIYPLWHVAMSSISDPMLATEGGFFFLPRGDANFQAYAKVFQTRQILTSYINTIFVVGVGTACNMVVTVLLAYAISKRNVKGVGFVTVLIVFTMIFKGGMIPTFLAVRQIGLLNSRFAMFVPDLVIPFNLLVLRNFFRTIPDSLEEAAEIDGCSVPQTLVRVVLPLSMTSIVTISLFYGVFHWNNFRPCMLYVTDETKYVLQLILRNLYMEGDTSSMEIAQETTEAFTPESIKMATVMVATLPIMLVYPFIQKYFVKGIVIGAVKG